MVCIGIYLFWGFTMTDSKTKWNRKYGERLMNGEESLVNERLKKFEQYFPDGGMALDFACGLGQNSIYLAEQGFHVQSFDISDVAIQNLRAEASKKQLHVEAKVSDLTEWSNLSLSKDSFNLVVITYYLDREIIPKLKQVLDKSGLFFLETFYQSNKCHSDGVSDRYKLQSQELLVEFKDWQILFFEENEEEGRQTILCRKI